jgi:tRNA nucleotidyltransferase (CCA-adding enzyme)
VLHMKITTTHSKIETSTTLKSLIKERLNKDVIRYLESITQIGGRLNVPVYAVGGFVRDLILNVPNKDIDIVVEGEGIPFAVCLAELFGGKIKSHEKFGTSVVILSNGDRIDVATARTEYYKYPAALPTVKRGSIKSDLFRRDFTVNSMAIKLTGTNAFCLIDFFNGERDLRSRKIHVLHGLSFIEDPCRLFRAIRFEQRFGFEIASKEQVFMRTSIKKNLVDSLSGTRLFNEIKLLLNEKKTMDCIRRMQEFDLFQFVSPEMFKEPQDLEVLERLESIFLSEKRIIIRGKPKVWYVYLLGLFYSLDEVAFLKAAKRLNLPNRIKNSLCEDRTQCRESLEKLTSKKKCEPVEVYHAFANLSVEGVVFLMALSSTDRINKYANIYFNQYQGRMKPSLTGNDLVKMGVEPGPVYRFILNALREARIEGSVKSREEETALVEERFLKP